MSVRREAIVLSNYLSLSEPGCNKQAEQTAWRVARAESDAAKKAAAEAKAAAKAARAAAAKG